MKTSCSEDNDSDENVIAMKTIPGEHAGQRASPMIPPGCTAPHAPYHGMDVERKKIALGEAKISAALNLGLFGIKLALAVMISSIALTADAFHTLSDISTSIVIIISFHAASHKPDDEHPFGHGRWEPIATLIIAVMLVSAGIQVFLEGVRALVSGGHGQASLAVAMVVLMTAGVKELLARYAFNLGDRIESRTLHADAWHHRTDALSSLGVALAIVFSDTLPFVDSAAAILVSFLIIWTGLNFIRETSSVLLGTAPDAAVVKRIKEIAVSHPEVLDIHKIIVHDYISSRSISLHIVVDGELGLDEAHGISEVVEEMLERKFDATVIVHVDPAPDEPGGFNKRCEPSGD